MTESDWVEMYGMAFSAGVANSGLLITLMSGYLVAAYLVGKRLTRTQIIVTNTLYLISAFLFVGGAFQTNMDAQIARKMMALQIPELDLLSYADVNIYLWPSIITIVYSCLVFASLFFMWHVRNSREI
jgi:high-affinity Fe2+/Pb2+ permease